MKMFNLTDTLNVFWLETGPELFHVLALCRIEYKLVIYQGLKCKYLTALSELEDLGYDL